MRQPVTEYTYTREQLELLARCIIVNDNLPGAVAVFFDTANIEPGCHETIEWFRRAGEIAKNPNYVSQLFGATATPTKIEVVL